MSAIFLSNLYFLLFIYNLKNLSIKGTGSKEKIKLTFLRLFDKPLSKHIILKNFLHPMAVLGYSAKLKRGLGLAFGAHFLHGFSMKILYI